MTSDSSARVHPFGVFGKAEEQVEEQAASIARDVLGLGGRLFVRFEAVGAVCVDGAQGATLQAAEQLGSQETVGSDISRLGLRSEP